MNITNGAKLQTKDEDMSWLTRFRPIVILACSLVLFFSHFNALAQSEADSTEKKQQDYKAKDILTRNTPEQKLYTLRKIKLLDDATEDVSPTLSDTNGSDIAFNLDAPLPFFLDEEGLKMLDPGPGAKDWIGEELQRRHTGIPPTVTLNDAIRSLMESFKKKPERRETRDLPLPTDMEIDILKVLWVEKKATAREIYTNLDTSHVIFAEELYAVLERMVDRGFLDRKKISPSHELSLFGIAQIELSSKNRKNKQYLYWPIVTKEQLFTYLDAKRFLAMTARSENDYDLKNNKYQANYQKLLENKLYRLFE